MVKFPLPFPLRLDEIIPTSAMEKLMDVLQQPDISGKVREALHKVGLQDAAPLDKIRDAWQQARGWIDSVTESVTGNVSHPRVLNASGQLLSSSLASIPWSTSAAVEFAKSATDYQASATIQRQADELSRRIFGAHETAWLGNTVEALRWLSSAAAASHGVVISRVDAVRIVGLGDVRAMLATSGEHLLEIGAANGVRAEEWKSALTSSEQLLVLVSPNTLAIEDSRQHRQQAVEAAKACGATVVELLADGVVSPKMAEAHAFPGVQQSLETGADVVILPTHLLMAGPVGALVVGNQKIVSALRSDSENIGALLSGANLLTTLSALDTANKAGIAPETDQFSMPTQLLLNPANLRNRAQRLAIQLKGLGEVLEALEVELINPLGPSPWNRHQINSWGVRLRPRSSLLELSQQILRGENRRGVKLELINEPESLAINLRFVPPQYDHELVQIIGGDPQGNKLDLDESSPN